MLPFTQEIIIIFQCSVTDDNDDDDDRYSS